MQNKLHSKIENVLRRPKQYISCRECLITGWITNASKKKKINLNNKCFRLEEITQIQKGNSYFTSKSLFYIKKYTDPLYFWLMEHLAQRITGLCLLEGERLPLSLRPIFWMKIYISVVYALCLFISLWCFTLSSNTETYFNFATINLLSVKKKSHELNYIS